MELGFKNYRLETIFIHLHIAMHVVLIYNAYMGKGELTISDVLGAIADLAKRITKLENRMEDKFNMIEERFNLLKSGQADLKTLIKTKVLEHDRKILALQRNTNFISDYMDSVEKFQKMSKIKEKKPT